MSFPVILVDSTNGAASDTACSGAGPSTAKTGTSASSTSTTNIDITDTVDLSGVSTAGDAVIYFADTTAGHRRFARITNVTGGPSGSTWHITLDSNSPVTTSVGPFSWAIGGTRATVCGTVSTILWANNGAAGDMKPGWKLQMQSGHSEPTSATFRIRCAGDTTTGPIIFQGAAGTMPEIQVNVADYACEIIGNYVQLTNFAVKRTGNCTYGIVMNTTSIYCRLDGMKVWGSSSFTNDGIYCGAINNAEVVNCSVANTGANGISVNGDSPGVRILCNYVNAPGTNGIRIVNGGGTIQGNIIQGAVAGDGIHVEVSSSGFRAWHIIGNTINGSSGDGIEFTAAADSTTCSMIVNNILSNNGAYGLNYSAGGATDAYLLAGCLVVFGNQTYLNTTRAYHSATAAYDYNTCPWASGDNNLNPTYTNTAGNDYSIGTNLASKGYPVGGTLAVGTTSSTYSYVDPGAAQRVPPVSSGPGSMTPFPGG